MIAALIFAVCALGPVVWWLIQQKRQDTPSIQWPRIAGTMNMKYEANPPRLSGERQGRAVTIDPTNQGFRVAAKLARPTLLRLEIGDKEEVTKRAGVLVPDPVKISDSAWAGRLLARCNQPTAGEQILEPVLRERILRLPQVEILGKGELVQALIKEAKDPDALEEVMDIVAVIAAELERFPAHA